MNTHCSAPIGAVRYIKMLGYSSVFLIPEKITNQPSKCSLIKLRHPRSDVPYLYLWDNQSLQLFEIQRIDEKCRSWMICGEIKSDGGMYVCNRIDPLFFLISFCKKQTKFVSWDAILGEIGGCFDIFNKIPNLENRLEEICEKKCAGDIFVYRYSESKAMEWLSNRVSAVYKASLNCKDSVLNSQLRIIASSSSYDCNDEKGEDSRVPEFTSCSEEAQMLSTNQLPNQMCLKLAFQLVADYLPPDLLDSLREKLGLGTNKVDLSDMNSRIVNSENVDPVDQLPKSVFSTSCQPKEDYSSALKLNESKISEPLTKKAKIPKGVQSITNFFGKK
ncbi:hypothetical protein MN116_004533 [Schistosoma mekongi]|uniref:Ribonuclease H2 subunit B n=1 Tax=Schistosoma mekongi TaxID=38744 RepID=A0AAE1ZFN4_SCHME|nr:hypothetical protein MN116_004533 [Schistosoma mekongi]